MNSTPENYGIVKTAVGEARLQPIPIPRLRDGYIFVKTIAVAINPTDWQTVDEKSSPRTKGPTLLGCDFAGIVVEVGKGVEKEWKKGDRIAGMAHGGNDLEPEDGTFATYIVVKGDVAFHIPDNVSFEEAASLGVGVTTVALGFYKYLSLTLLKFPLSMPNRQRELPILIYGGSSATGTLAIQFAKLSGLQVITTTSPKNFELLKSLGADHVLDYHDTNCGAEIRSLTQNKLHHVFDTIATQSSAQICANALSTSGHNLYVNLMGIEMPRDDVRNIFFLGYSVTGEEYEIEGEVWPAAPEDFELGKKAFALLERLLENGLIKNHPVKIMHGGLKGILEGMREMKEGKVSGEKLIYRVGEP
ncbi:putative zinc-binding oxidoreductase protein [Botrytis fragariae]|uniref:Putative zinc-binding oxidoreductase protein n=1 Tax=Botrytis fragariae TaxID=1964551 RepID=A0A8H6AFD1_9HELO|nr:putative zinc-binding oxidoreductase protein [Botrytis fragariae]KAF5867476.1 putative zinc-binding oxidoreductase protein [Botrytis fragariae]